MRDQPDAIPRGILANISPQNCLASSQLELIMILSTPLRDGTLSPHYIP